MVSAVTYDTLEYKKMCMGQAGRVHAVVVYHMYFACSGRGVKRLPQLHTHIYNDCIKNTHTYNMNTCS